MHVTLHATSLTAKSGDSPYQTTPLRPRTGATPRQRAPAPAPGAGFAGPFGGPRLNSRLAVGASVGQMRFKYSANLRAGSAPTTVAYTADRVVAISESWQLFDRAGKPIWDERSGLSPLTLDAEKGVLFHVAVDGDFIAFNLSDGRRSYAFMPYRGDQYAYPWVGRSGSKIVFASTERRLDPHGHEPPTRSGIEVVDLSKPPKIGPTESKILLSADSRGMLEFPSTEMIAAGDGKTVAAAYPGQIFFVGDDLKIRAAFDGDFVPETMSVDEAGNVYMIARAGGMLKLHQITPVGEILWTADLPAAGEGRPKPPILGYDRRVFVLSAAGRLSAFSADGKPLWDSNMQAPIAGATVGTDDHLIVACGSKVCVYDPSGACRTIYTLPADTCSTPPVVTDKGEVLIASATKLYCLEPKP